MSVLNVPSSISTFSTPYKTNYSFLTLNTPFVPTQLSNLGLWLDASDINGNGSQPADNSAVTTWVDKSPNGFNATQANVSYKPTYSNNGVFFSNDNTTGLVINNLVSTYPSSRNSETFFAVINQTRTGTSATDDLCIIRPTSFSPNCNRAIYIDSNNLLNTGVVVNSNTNKPYLAYTNVPLDKTCLITNVNPNGINIDHYVNGYNLSSIVSTTNGFSSSNTSNTIIGTDSTNYDSRNGYNGVINELIIYSNILTSNQVFNVQNYLMQKWNILSSNTSNFLPDQFSNLGAWYDSADIYANNTNPSYGTAMSNWQDKSANNYNLLQGTSALQPTFTADGVFFSNTNNNGTSNGFIFPYNTPGTDETIFIAMKPVPIASLNDQFMIACDSNIGRSILLSSITNMATIISPSFTFNRTLIGGYVQPNSLTLLTLLTSNTTLSHYINGNLAVSGSFSNVVSISNHYLGLNGNNGFNGSIYEIIIYSNALTSNQRNVVEFYLRQKWSYNLNSNNIYVQLNDVRYPLIQQYLLPSYNQLLPNSYQSTIYIQTAGPTINTLAYPIVSSFLSTAGIYRSKNIPF